MWENIVCGDNLPYNVNSIYHAWLDLVCCYWVLAFYFFTGLGLKRNVILFMCGVIQLSICRWSL